MIRYALPLLAASALATPALAEVQIAAEGPVVSLTVTEQVAADPDIAELGAGVTTMARSAVEAMQQNATRMAQVIARIEALGVAQDDIRTAGISLNPEYDYDQATQQQVFRGYRASNRVSVTLRAIERTGQVLDELVAAGATDLGGIGWSLSDPSAARAQARTAAFERARTQALDYARMAGFNGIRLLEISENTGFELAMPMAMADVAMRQESTPVRPGQVQTGVTVNVTYAMTP